MIVTEFLDTIARQLWLHLLLRLPALYFYRVARVFEDAALTRGDIKAMTRKTRSRVPVGPNEGTANRLLEFERLWSTFIDSLRAEWQAQGILAALLLPSVLTMLQIDKIVSDPVSSILAFASLICALMNLMYGTTLYTQLSYMRSLAVASHWAEKAEKVSPLLWNLWVFLSMPAVWLCWSIGFFMAALGAYVWRAHFTRAESFATLTPQQALGPRIAITALFSLGLICLFFVLRTLMGMCGLRQAECDIGVLE